MQDNIRELEAKKENLSCAIKELEQSVRAVAKLAYPHPIWILCDHHCSLRCEETPMNWKKRYRRQLNLKMLKRR